MPSFRTELNYDTPHPPLERSHKIAFSGSCFAEHFGRYFQELGYNILCNPAGVIFNPVSLFKLCNRALSGELFTQDELFFHDGLWRSFDVHSRVCGSDREETLKVLNQKLRELEDYLKNCDHLFFTFGTALAFVRKNKTIAANCHKLPQSEFEQKLLSEEELQSAFADFQKRLSKVNSKVEITVTVSPVRHLKSGFVENNRSKSRLLLFCAELEREPNINYFPAYELVMDDLRDYRFYNRDKVHPSDEAVKYIRDVMEGCFLSERDREINRRIHKLIGGLKHLPENVSDRKKLQISLLKKARFIKKEYGYIPEALKLRLENI